jgi:hypothetical protein
MTDQHTTVEYVDHQTEGLSRDLMKKHMEV